MPKQPNLLWIFCDQLRWHSLSCHGEPNVSTPHLDRLAAEGIDCDLAISTCPVCTPARACVMTGRYPHQTGVRYLGDVLLPDQPTVAKTFRRAGYRTSYVGKWHLASSQNIIGTNAGADYWVHPKLRGGFEDWFGFELSNHFWKTHYCTDDSMWPPKVIEGYQTDRLTDLSLDYLDSTALHLNQPWFHVLSVEAPHHGSDEHEVATCRVGRHSHSRHPAPPEYEARFRPEAMILRGNTPASHDAVARSHHAQYCAQIANLDDNVGRVLSWLDERGLTEQTVVCFFSDHGEMGGSQGRFHKERAYDEALRVPCLFRQPGRIPPGNYGQPLGLVDVFPSSAGLCDVPLPKGVPAPKSARKAALAQWFGNPRYRADGQPGPQWRGIRTERWTYCVWEDGEGLLYDNWTDPLQQQNLFGESKHPQRRLCHAMLVKELKAAHERVPAFVSRAAT